MLCLFGFAFSVIAGYYFGETISKAFLEEIMGGIPDFEGFDILIIFSRALLFILVNNVSKTFLWMVLGVLGGLPPMFFAVFNGYIIGLIAYNSALNYGLGVIVASLLPHGIIEIPTVLLSSAVGMGLGYSVINRLRGQGSLKAEFGKALRLFITKIVPLLTLAGIIESLLIAIALSTI